MKFCQTNDEFVVKFKEQNWNKRRFGKCFGEKENGKIPCFLCF